MTNNSTKTPDSPRAKRLVTVDGVRYSLNTGDRLGPAVARRLEPTKNTLPPRQNNSKFRKQRSERLGELPLPKAIELTAHQQAIMHPDPKLRAAAILHPHGVSHPSLPLPSQRSRETGASLWSEVIEPSLADGRSRKSVLASIGIVLLSPVTWLYVFLPALVLILTEVRRKSLQSLYADTVNILRTTPADRVFWLLIAAVSALGVVWFVKHLCLIVAYGLAAKKIDNRSASARHLWLQAAGKILRFAVIAAFDFLLTVAAVAAIISLFTLAYSGRAEPAQAGWSLLFNFGILLAGMWVWLISTHRPLTRVMLALTNRPASFIVVRSFGLIFRNWWRALAIGITWLVIATLTAVTVAAICWATGVYGMLQITTSTGRFLLLGFAAVLVMFILSLFTIWSVSYWPRAYHWLARLAYPQQISQLMADTHNQKSTRRVVAGVVLLVLLFVGVIVGSAIMIKPYFSKFYERSVQSLPDTAQDLLR